MKNKYKLNKKTYILLLYIVSILFLFTFEFSSSRYMREVKGQAEDVIAIPIISLDNPTFNYRPDDMIPGYVDEADFYVKNYDNTKQNEVLMKYYLKIKVDSIIPVKVTLTSEDGVEIVLTEDETEKYELPYTEEMLTKYHIKIEWDEKDNDFKYANEDIKLNIDLIAVQVVEGS